jgi:hypothetical protein
VPTGVTLVNRQVLAAQRKSRIAQRDQQNEYWKRKGYGLDWAAIKKQHDERLAQDLANGVDNEQTRAIKARNVAKPVAQREKPVRTPKTKAPAKRKQPKQKKGRDTVQNRSAQEVMIEMYNNNIPVSEIMKATGAAGRTIRKYLREAGIYDPRRDMSLVRRQKKCGKGHDMTDESNIVEFEVKSGPRKGKMTRACRECRRLRSSKRWEEKKNAQRTS